MSLEAMKVAEVADCAIVTGTGTDLYNQDADTSWWNPTAWQQDELYSEMAFGLSGLQFYLGHHTFSHGESFQKGKLGLEMP